MRYKPTYVILLLISIGCSNPDKGHPITKFLENRNYKFSNQMADIPSSIVLSIMDKEKNLIKLADSSKIDSLCLTDDCNVGFPYNAKLNFLLHSDSEYLISYTKGGVGVYGVITFFKEEGNSIFFSKNVVPPIEDTINLLKRIFPYLTLSLNAEDSNH